MIVIVQSTLLTLQKSHNLLLNLSNDELSNSSISPYYSSIGSHVRHILDFYDCALSGSNNNNVDLTVRKRNFEVENSCNSAIEYYEIIINKLKSIDTLNNKNLIVVDNLGAGNIEIEYTFSALLAQANSHTIHHYAIIWYIIDRLNINIDDSYFGYNPTTPKEVIDLN